MIEINFPFRYKNISRKTHSGWGSGVGEGLFIIYALIHLHFVLNKRTDITYSKN